MPYDVPPRKWYRHRWLITKDMQGRTRTMEIRSVHAWAVARFEFPVTLESVIDDAGAVEVAAPEPADSETISTILERGGSTRYRSPSELVNDIMGNVSDCYIGRKYYDDRGTNPLLVGATTNRKTDLYSF